MTRNCSVGEWAPPDEGVVEGGVGVIVARGPMEDKVQGGVKRRVSEEMARMENGDER